MNSLTPHDLVLIKDKAITYYNSYPQRCRFKGMDRDLTDEEKRQLAYVEASCLVLARFGIVDNQKLVTLAETFVAVYESVDDCGIG